MQRTLAVCCLLDLVAGERDERGGQVEDASDCSVGVECEHVMQSNDGKTGGFVASANVAAGRGEGE